MTGFVSTTRVRIDDGALASLYQLSQATEEAHVVTCDRNGQVNSYHAVAPGISGDTDQITVVTIHGDLVRCTPDVEFMLADRSYKAAAALVAGDVLRVWPMGVYTLTEAATTLTLSSRVPVYDITVPGPSNFALACGPFVRALGSNWV